MSSTDFHPAHIHGPNCAHEFKREEPHAARVTPLAKVEQFKYTSAKDIPAYDLAETFKTNDGPNWEPNMKKAAEHVWNRTKSVPEGEVLVLFTNVEFYKKFCLYISRQIIPTGTNQMLESGIMGMFGPKCVIVCDAPVNLQLTDLRAYYFCTEVIKQPQPDEVKTE